MKILYLTGISTVPSEAGEEKIARANGQTKEQGGMSKSWYLENNLRPPDDVEDEIETDELGRVILKESDLEEVNVDIAIPLHLFAGCEDLVDGTTLVYTTYGYQFTVEETVDEITSYVNYLSMSWWDNFKVNTRIFFNNLFSHKNKNINN